VLLICLQELSALKQSGGFPIRDGKPHCRLQFAESKAGCNPKPPAKMKRGCRTNFVGWILIRFNGVHARIFFQLDGLTGFKAGQHQIASSSTFASGLRTSLLLGYGFMWSSP
jgi:hypothetical protein